MSKCLKFCTFKTDFHSKMSVCRHELEGGELNSQPRQFHCNCNEIDCGCIALQLHCTGTSTGTGGCMMNAPSDLLRVPSRSGTCRTLWHTSPCLGWHCWRTTSCSPGCSCPSVSTTSSSGPSSSSLHVTRTSVSHEHTSSHSLVFHML